MGKDKNKQLRQLLAFVKDLYDNPDNKEFVAGIQSLVLEDLKIDDNRETWTRQINDIYELCLKKNLREQAEDLYKDFPVSGIVDELSDLYVKMEDARRANDFDSFGCYLFLQIELIVGTIVKDPEFVAAYEGIRGLKPLTKYDYQKKETTRADFIQNKKNQDGTKEQVIKDTVDKYLLISGNSVGNELSKMFALDKCRIVIYTVCFRASVSSWPSEEFDTLSAIYNVRCHESHSGVTTTSQQEAYYKKLLEDKTQNYLRFLGFLLRFIQGISANYPLPESVKKLAGLAQ